MHRMGAAFMSVPGYNLGADAEIKSSFPMTSPISVATCTPWIPILSSPPVWSGSLFSLFYSYAFLFLHQAIPTRLLF